MSVKSREDLQACHECKRVMLRRNIYSHLFAVHNYNKDQIERVKEKIKREMALLREDLHVTCPACHDSFVDHEGLAHHCEAVHSEDGANGEEQDYTVHSLFFETQQEFEVWLQDNCEATITSLTRRSSGINSYSLRCNRAGRYVCKSDRRASSSKKDVINCSCFVNVHVGNDGSVSVKGCFGHVGHAVEPALLRLTSAQKQFIKTLLEEHSMDYVIKKLRKEFSSKTSRLHYVTKADLWAIVKKHGLRPVCRDHNDMKSLQMRGAERNPDDRMHAHERMPPIPDEQLEEPPSRNQPVSETESSALLQQTESAVPAQQRLDQRKSMRYKIKMLYSVVSTNVNALVNQETTAALRMLQEIYAIVDKASKISVLLPSQAPPVAVRPELSHLEQSRS